MTTSLLSVLAAASGAQPSAMESIITSPIPMIVMVGLVMWLFVMRPQMKQQKDHRAKLDGLKKGDQVLTGGGLIGKVVKVEDAYVEVELAANVKVRALKSTITDVIPPGGTPAAND